MSAHDPDDETSALRKLERQLGFDATAAPKPVEPTQDGRARLMAAIDHAGRFERFVPAVAAMADVSETQARAWLDNVWGERPMWEWAAPAARAWWVEGGPKTENALRGFVHIAAGQAFPHHKHLGDEHFLILQGGAKLSSGERLRAGDAMTTGTGEEHSFVAVAGGADLLVFTVIFEGLDFGRYKALPR